MTFANSILTYVTTLIIAVPAYWIWHAIRAGSDFSEGLVQSIVVSIAVVGVWAALPAFIAFGILWVLIDLKWLQGRRKGVIVSIISAWVGISVFFQSFHKFMRGYAPVADVPAIEAFALSGLAGAVAFLVWTANGIGGP